MRSQDGGEVMLIAISELRVEDNPGGRVERPIT